MADNTPSFGTNTTFDLLASSTQTIAQFGEDRAWDAIVAQQKVHNAMAQDMMSGMVVRTTDKLRRYGGNAQMKMVELDQHGVADAQKVTAGALVGFPLRLYGETLQWTRKYLQSVPAKELAAQYSAALDADIARFINELKKAIFLASNYTWQDTLVFDLQSFPLPVKRLVNADGAPIPMGPGMVSFNGATHQHYLNNGTLTATWLNAVVDTVLEHYEDGEPLLYINRNNEDEVRALAGFKEYLEINVERGAGNTNDYAVGRRVNQMKVFNRAIGRYRGCEVWVKPWMIEDYYFPFVKGAPAPVVMRVRADTPGAGDFQLVFDDEEHPIRARGYEREYGLGIWNRTNGAIGYVGNGGAGYVEPTL